MIKYTVDKYLRMQSKQIAYTIQIQYK